MLPSDSGADRLGGVGVPAGTELHLDVSIGDPVHS